LNDIPDDPNDNGRDYRESSRGNDEGPSDATMRRLANLANKKAGNNRPSDLEALEELVNKSRNGSGSSFRRV
jgi:hypothetical protein